jgi:cytidylate kinase
VRHLCLYGLTAAGKSTHATLLAQQLQMDYISASQLMLQRIGYNDAGDHLTWHRSSAMIAEARRSGEVDDAVNEELAARFEYGDPAVFDSWALPYLTRRNYAIAEQVFFVRLNSDLNSRAIRCLVSQGPNPAVSVGGAVSLVRSKDDSTRDQFKRLYGVDVVGEGNLRVNQIRISLSNFVYGSSTYQVRRGISSAHAKILAALRAANVLDRLAD